MALARFDMTSYIRAIVLDITWKFFICSIVGFDFAGSMLKRPTLAMDWLMSPLPIYFVGCSLA